MRGNSRDSKRISLHKIATNQRSRVLSGLSTPGSASSDPFLNVIPINVASRRNSLISSVGPLSRDTASAPKEIKKPVRQVPKIPVHQTLDDALDPSTATESDYFYFSKNTERFWKEQESILFSESVNSTARRTSQRTHRPESSSSSSSVSPSRAQTSHSHTPRSGTFSYGNIIRSRRHSQSMKVSRTIFDDLEEEHLGEDIRRIYQQPKALTLWSMSEGVSTISDKIPNVAYFMDDFERFVRTDSQMRSRPTSARSERRGSRPSTSHMSGRNEGGSFQRDSLFKPYIRDARTLSVIDRFVSARRKDGIPSSTFIEIPERSMLDPVINDPTWRSYIATPTGRAVSSIYHPATHRPSHIINFVDKSTVTNESLYTYITTELVEELDLERCFWIGNSILESIGQYCLQLAVLNLQHCHQLLDKTLAVIAGGCPNISSLNIGMCSLVTDHGLQEIFVHCHDLRVLSIHSCTGINGTSFQHISNCKGLEVLDISYCTALKDFALQHVAEHCKYLLHLDASGCSSLGDDGVLSICRHCENLETLRLMLCDQPTLTSHCLGAITKFGQSIRALELTGVRQLTDDDISSLAQHGFGIEFLSLNGCSGLTDKSLSSIMLYCRRLKCCEICACHSMTLQGMIDLVHNIRTLTRLIISECNISESELEILKKVTPRCVIVKQGHVPLQPMRIVTMKPRAKKKLKKKRMVKKGAKKKKKKK